MYSDPIEHLIKAFSRLPTVGKRSAERFVFYLLKSGKKDVAELTLALKELIEKIKSCQVCWNFSDQSPCAICANNQRDRRIICVVSEPQDVQAIEAIHEYKGKYHVLHGIIDPLNGIDPEELYIDDLVTRIADLIKSLDAISKPIIPELILALSTSLEGESTALYISRLIRDKFSVDQVKITRLARGLPVGGDVEYADEVTLSKALEGRVSI